MNVDIPDESLWRHVAARHGGGPIASIEAAAPHIARAAQVQMLRELHDELEPQVQRLMRGNGTRAAGMAAILAVMARKADELEAGAGQTGERNV